MKAKQRVFIYRVVTLFMALVFLASCIGIGIALKGK